MNRTPRSILCVALAALPAAAQDIYLMVGFAGNLNNAQSKPVTRAIDLDGDGFADGRSELFTFVNRAFSINNGGTPPLDNGSFITDMAVVVENGKPTFYWADSGDGYVVRAQDVDNDGVIQDTEIAIWAHWGTSRTFAPDSMVAVRAGNRTIVYAALDSTAPGLWRCVDLNNDGDALDAGENTLFVGQSSALQVPGVAGPVTLNANRWLRVRAVVDINNVVTVYAYEAGSTSRTATIAPDDFGYYAFTDVNGVATNPRVFFNPSKLNALAQNADIQSGALPDLDIVPPPTTRTTRFNNWFQHEIERFAGPAGQDVHWFTTDYGPGRSFGSVNGNGIFLHGVVIRGIDLNQDGDLQDAGEVTIFHNGSSNTINGIAPPSFINRATNQATTDIGDFITGLAAVNGLVYFYYNNGGDDAVLALNDLNRNGFTENGEVVMPFFTPRNPYPPVYHPTLGPFSLELAVLPEGLEPGPFAPGLSPFGEGCTGSNGLNPVIDARGGSPTVGNSAFVVRGSRMPPFPLGVFLLGASNTNVFGVPLPLDLTTAGMPGCFLRVSLSIITFATGNQAGIVNLPLPIPNDPSLVGASAFAQWLSVDLPANAGGLVPTNGLQITFQ